MLLRLRAILLALVYLDLLDVLKEARQFWELLLFSLFAIMVMTQLNDCFDLIFLLDNKECFDLIKISCVNLKGTETQSRS